MRLRVGVCARARACACACACEHSNSARTSEVAGWRDPHALRAGEKDALPGLIIDGVPFGQHVS